MVSEPLIFVTSVSDLEEDLESGCTDSKDWNQQSGTAVVVRCLSRGLSRALCH